MLAYLVSMLAGFWIGMCGLLYTVSYWIDEIWDLPVTNMESASSAHSRLQHLIQRIIEEALHLPAFLDWSGCPRDQNGKLPEFNPKTYEDLLATAILNKVIDRYQQDPKRSTGASSSGVHSGSSSPGCDEAPVTGRSARRRGRHRISARDSAGLDRSSPEPASHDDYANSDSSGRASESLKRTYLKNESSDEEEPTEALYKDPVEAALSNINFQHKTRVIFPEYGGDVIELDGKPVSNNFVCGKIETNEGLNNNTEIYTNNNSWEENWLFQKKKVKNTQSVSVPMLVPNPNAEYRPLIGDREADDTTDLSEAGSESDEKTEDSTDIKKVLVNSKTIIGGKNPVLALIEQDINDNVIDVNEKNITNKMTDDSQKIIISEKNNNDITKDYEINKLLNREIIKNDLTNENVAEDVVAPGDIVETKPVHIVEDVYEIRSELIPANNLAIKDDIDNGNEEIICPGDVSEIKKIEGNILTEPQINVSVKETIGNQDLHDISTQEVKEEIASIEVIPIQNVKLVTNEQKLEETIKKDISIGNGHLPQYKSNRIDTKVDPIMIQAIKDNIIATKDDNKSGNTSEILTPVEVIENVFLAIIEDHSAEKHSNHGIIEENVPLTSQILTREVKHLIDDTINQSIELIETLSPEKSAEIETVNSAVDIVSISHKPEVIEIPNEMIAVENKPLVESIHQIESVSDDADVTDVCIGFIPEENTSLIESLENTVEEISIAYKPEVIEVSPQIENEDYLITIEHQVIETEPSHKVAMIESIQNETETPSVAHIPEVIEIPAIIVSTPITEVIQKDMEVLSVTEAPEIKEMTIEIIASEQTPTIESVQSVAEEISIGYQPEVIDISTGVESLENTPIIENIQNVTETISESYMPDSMNTEIYGQRPIIQTIQNIMEVSTISYKPELIDVTPGDISVSSIKTEIVTSEITLDPTIETRESKVEEVIPSVKKESTIDTVQDLIESLGRDEVDTSLRSIEVNPNTYIMKDINEAANLDVDDRLDKEGHQNDSEYLETIAVPVQRHMDSLKRQHRIKDEDEVSPPPLPTSRLPEKKENEEIFIPGSIAEREHKKWQNAVPMANNPYSPEAIEKRLNKQTKTPLFDIVPMTPNPSIEEEEEVKPKPKAMQEVLGEGLDLNRHSRDYYINESKKATGTRKYYDENPTKYSYEEYDNVEVDRPTFIRSSSEAPTSTLKNKSIEENGLKNRHRSQNDIQILKTFNGVLSNEEQVTEEHVIVESKDGIYSAVPANSEPDLYSAKPVLVANVEEQFDDVYNTSFNYTSPDENDSKLTSLTNGSATQSDLLDISDSISSPDESMRVYNIQSGKVLSDQTVTNSIQDILYSDNVEDDYENDKITSTMINNMNKSWKSTGDVYLAAIEHKEKEKTAVIEEDLDLPSVKNLRRMFIIQNAPEPEIKPKKVVHKEFPNNAITKAYSSSQSNLRQPLHMHSLTARSIPKEFRDELKLSMPEQAIIHPGGSKEIPQGADPIKEGTNDRPDSPQPEPGSLKNKLAFFEKFNRK